MKNFTLHIIIRVLLLTIALILTIMAFLDERIIINRFILMVLDILFLSEIIRYLHYTNRQLTLFIQSLKQEDFTVSFPRQGMGKSFDRLNKSFQEVITDFRNKRIQGRGHDQFLEMAFDRINVGVLTIDENGAIIQMNASAMELLNTEKLHSFASLQRFVPAFHERISLLHDPGHSTLELSRSGQPVHLSIRTARMNLESNEYRLITFQDIREALDEKEIDSWIRLIRILTHEIMNSVTPISSLSETMNNMLLNHGVLKEPEQLTAEQLQDISFSLQTISRRSDGLLSFVENYRKFTRVSKPKKSEVATRSLIDDVLQLMKTEIHSGHHTIHVDLKGHEKLWADKTLLEQVVINLIQNSIDALEYAPDPAISIRQEHTDAMDILVIEDNGSGISADELNEVFVPFFTTKQKGSGIGLSLSRQILHLHGGTIKIESDVTKGTICKLYLPTLP